MKAQVKTNQTEKRWGLWPSLLGEGRLVDAHLTEARLNWLNARQGEILLSDYVVKGMLRLKSRPAAEVGGVRPS